jgi:hypothetical protein
MKMSTNLQVLRKEWPSDQCLHATEDTFILLDALEKDLDLLKEKHPLLCLEIG